MIVSSPRRNPSDPELAGGPGGQLVERVRAAVREGSRRNDGVDGSPVVEQGAEPHRCVRAVGEGREGGAEKQGAPKDRAGDQSFHG